MLIEELDCNTFRTAFKAIGKSGFASINISNHYLVRNAKRIFEAIDRNYDSGSRGRYYNEISFHWPEEWKENGGISCFHEETTVRNIKSYPEAHLQLGNLLNDQDEIELIEFIKRVKQGCINNHPDSKGRRLKLARVMLRQMALHEPTMHQAKFWHEDIGYSDRPFLQYLSAIITLYGRPTIAKNYEPKVGELLLFNAFHRRRDKGMPEEKAFIHRGPQEGPKLFLFFEFLIPR